MKRLDLSDLHIGLEPDGRMERIINWCEKYKPDEVVLHGDTFHLNELGQAVFDTQDFNTLLSLSVYHYKIILGNHDWQLRTTVKGYLPIVEPFVDEAGFYHSHWHEFDPISKMPTWWHMLMAWFNRSRTPRILKEQDSTAFWACCQVIHTRAAEWAFNPGNPKVLIGGHSHMPMHLSLLDSGVELWNCGDLCDSNTGILQEGTRLEFVRFQEGGDADVCMLEVR